MGGSSGFDADPLAPYVPRLVVDWLAEQPQREHRRIEGSCVFADISGFTNLTERLAARGKAGAEEMGTLLNTVFDELLTAAYDFGANLIKWGGDAVLLLFDADAHAARAARAAWDMQSVMRRTGRLRTSCGPVRLGMSIGVHTGAIDFLLVGNHHRELIVTGPAATTTTRMEKIAERGQIVISADTAAALGDACLGEPVGTGFLLAAAPQVTPSPNRRPKRADVDLGHAVSAHIRDHLRSGRVEDEHRFISVGFIEFSGTDELLTEHGADALTDAVTYVIDAVQEAADANDVTLLATDLAENGGKIIITAGAPRSAGDDETRLLSTVRRVVRPGGRLALRAGVTCGRVFAGDYGPFYRKTYSVAGDVVNLAARLMATARPGQVIATSAIAERSRTAFETTALAAFTVKGKSQPIDAVLIGDVRREHEPVAEQRLPLVGRDDELSAIVSAANHAFRGRGSVVDIVGIPGIGKTRLIEELGHRVSSRILWADGDIYGRATPYQPLHRLLRRTLALPADVADDVVAQALDELVRGSAPDLLPWLPLIGIAAGLDLPATAEIDQLDPEVRRTRLESATSDVLGRLLPTPLVMVLNDVQFMDEATLGLVRRLAADVVNRPWLLILTRRPGTPCPVDADPNVMTIELQPLPESAAAELLGVATDAQPLPAHRLRQLAERAGGNPLFLTQLVRAAASGADLDQLPDSLEGMIAAQIDRLPSIRRRWLRSASVLGMTVDPDWLAAMLAGSDLENETWAGLEEFITMSRDSRLHFAHHLVRLAAYEGLPYRRRAELHARAAEILESELGEHADNDAALLSLHCLHGQRYPEAWRYARLAGDQARAQYALAEAAECYRRALTAATKVPALPDDQVADVLEALAEVSMDMGEMADAEQALRHARARARTDPHRFARLHLKTARQRQHVGKHADAVRWVGRGRSVIAGYDDETALRLRAELAERGALIRYDQGSYRTSMAWAARAVEEARAAQDEGLEARGLGVLVAVSALNGMPVDESRVKQSLALYDSAGDLRGKARTSNALGVWAYFAGHWDSAIEYYAQAEQASTLIGRDHDAAMAACNRAEVLVQQGRYADAAPLVARAVRALVAAHATSFLAFAVTLRGRIATATGDFALAMDSFGEGRRLCIEMGEVADAVAIEAHSAECLLRAGQASEAIAVTTDVQERARRAGVLAAIAPQLHRVRGEALRATGEGDEADLELRRALDTARKHDTKYEIEASLRALLRLQVPATEEERSAWTAEHSDLATGLGIHLDA